MIRLLQDHDIDRSRVSLSWENGIGVVVSVWSKPIGSANNTIVTSEPVPRWLQRALYTAIDDGKL